MKKLQLFIIGCLFVFELGSLYGHSLRFGTLQIKETKTGPSYAVDFDFRLSVSKSEMARVQIHLPEYCQSKEAARIVYSKKEQRKTWRSVCNQSLNRAELKISGLSLDSQVLVRATLAGGSEQRSLLLAEKPSVSLTGGPTTGRTSGSDLTALGSFTVIGMEHIIFGFDHLLFIVGLILLAGFRRRLLWVVTAFTAGHGITILASVNYGTTLPQTPVEILIALSLAILAQEALQSKGGQATLLKRYPGLMSGLFGIVHGFGFAGALSELGYTSYSAVSLIGFNLGVEIGQVLFIGVLWGLHRLGQSYGQRLTGRWPVFAWQHVPHYAVGMLGMFWFWERLLSL